MKKEIQIQEAPLDIVYQLRRDVMYPDRSLEEVKLAEDDQCVHWGVYLDGEVVSVISLFQDGAVFRFRKFATRTDLQGKGYGSLLLEHTMQQAQEKGAKMIWCRARLAAIRLYERFGMYQVGEPAEENGNAFIKMEKQFS